MPSLIETGRHGPPQPAGSEGCVQGGRSGLREDLGTANASCAVGRRWGRRRHAAGLGPRRAPYRRAPQRQRPPELPRERPSSLESAEAAGKASRVLRRQPRGPGRRSGPAAQVVLYGAAGTRPSPPE